MATEKEKQELIDTLKFTPRNYTITLWGYGGEVAVAKINKEQFDYWKPKIDENGDSELVEHCVDWDNEIEVPKEARICENGAWYEVEGQIDHGSGVEFSDLNHIQIDDENGETVFDEGLSWELEEKHGVQLQQDEAYVGNVDGADYGFCFQSTEKGTFFSADLPLTTPFDPSKLKIYTTDYEGWELVTGVEYDGEALEGYDGYSTTGKGYYANVFET